MRKNVLIIDDDQSVLNSFKLAIDRSEYTVITALSADEGLLKAQIKEPGLIFLKRKMPRSDMTDSLKQLYRYLRDVPVCIIIEENDDTLEIDNAIRNGFNCKVCKKPLSSPNIANIVNDAFATERTISSRLTSPRIRIA